MRQSLLISILLSLFPLVSGEARTSLPAATTRSAQQKVIIIMFDGFGEEYYRSTKMPALNFIETHGIYKIVPSLMPSVTNVNNAAICTGELPSKNGITGNSFYNAEKNEEEFMEEDSLLLAPTIFERAARSGVRSALFSSKKKTISLLSRGAALAVSPETASEDWATKIGTPPSIYSREVNYWLMEAALYSMQHDPSLSLFYIHTTDYPMHTWAPGDPESKEHLKKMDAYIDRIMKTDPGAMILITADHTVNHKSVCLDIEKACLKHNLTIKMAVSAERDKYVKHHRGFGGTSYVYLDNKNDLQAVKRLIAGLKGVDEVLTNEEAVKKFHLMSTRIGDLVVLADKHTVFGNLDTEYENLPANYRTHGSIYEARVPLFLYNAPGAPSSKFFDVNYKLASWLFR